MTQLLDKALADEHQWDTEFARSQDQLAQLARKVRADIQAGQTTPGGFDTQYLEQG
jgi:hypothetical protein